MATTLVAVAVGLIVQLAAPASFFWTAIRELRFLPTWVGWAMLNTAPYYEQFRNRAVILREALRPKDLRCQPRDSSLRFATLRMTPGL